MVIGRLCVCKANIGSNLSLVTVVIDSELTLILFYLVSQIFVFLLTCDCRLLIVIGGAT